MTSPSRHVRQQFRPFSSSSQIHDEVWDDHYLELDTLGRYFLANLPRERSLYNDWPKLARALQQMPRELFWDFCGDVHEEIHRRNNDLRDGMFSLPSYDDMSLGRVYIRQKLSSISSDYFHGLCLHVGLEAGRRCSRLRPIISAHPLHRPHRQGRAISSFSYTVQLAKALGNYHDATKSESLPLRELNRSLDNLPDVDSWPQDYDFRGFRLPEAQDDHFSATISVIYSVFVSTLEDKERYASLLGCRGRTAQQVLDIIQMLLDYPTAGPVAKKSLLAALTRLSARSGLHPRRFLLNEIKKEEECVSTGSFSDIWKGRFKGQPVCLKIVKIYQGCNREALLRDYFKEAILWGHLSHPNILPFYGVYYLDDEYRRICLVSPWMENGDINEYLQTFPSASRVLLGSDVAAGLQYLHQQDIVHGDLKGPNILVTKNGRACLADFGLSTLLDQSVSSQASSDSTRIIGGTIRWQAPELLNPEVENPKATVESDVYSYGCVLYEIFVGRYPFHEYPRDVTVMLRIMEGKKPSFPAPESISFRGWGLTERLCTLIEDCWSTNSALRPTTSQIISRLALQKSDNLRHVNGWVEDHSASSFRNTVYRHDRISMDVLETVLSWI